MGHDSTSANAYLRTKVLTAPPEQLRLMLLDGAIRFASQGREAMERKDIEGMYAGVSQTRAIVFELLTTIGPGVDPALAERVRALYTFMYTRLLEGSTDRDPAKVDEVIGLLRYERETWALFVERLNAERGGRSMPVPAAIPTPAHTPGATDASREAKGVAGLSLSA